MRSCAGRSVMSSPKKRMRPAVGMKSPVIALNSVVLPAPLEPRTARRSPAAILMLMPDKRDQGAEVTGDAIELQRMRAGALQACCQGIVRHVHRPPPAFASGLRAARVVAADLAERQELLLRNAQRLVHLRHDLDELVVELAVGALGDFGQEDVGDRIAVLVERDLAGRASRRRGSTGPRATSCRRRTGRRRPRRARAAPPSC